VTEHPTNHDHLGEDRVDTSQPGHADTGSAAGVGGVTGAAIGALAGPGGAIVGAVGGMLAGAAAERAMHMDDDAEAERAARRTQDVAEADLQD
jgi:outer membrane lipoprotein SlyB